MPAEAAARYFQPAASSCRQLSNIAADISVIYFADLRLFSRFFEHRDYFRLNISGFSSSVIFFLRFVRRFSLFAKSLRFLHFHFSFRRFSFSMFRFVSFSLHFQLKTDDRADLVISIVLRHLQAFYFLTFHWLFSLQPASLQRWSFQFLFASRQPEVAGRRFFGRLSQAYFAENAAFALFSQVLAGSWMASAFSVAGGILSRARFQPAQPRFRAGALSSFSQIQDSTL